ncbi:hypothetical protein [Bifidobacterium mongoliense]|jgi:hypothetical protein|uniref:Uncharacterized protein n=1 Tax=Bifidobacterium mongoliense TaxID=518643 RepID=A0A423UC62_9BIFI|nr:hypothetical protein [Bifidobacterium mongoliense]ROT86285.1 hypothetical protein BMONG18_1605 [Bifidobacterium mongoliense]
MILEIEESARKHGCTDAEIAWAVMHHVGRQSTQGIDGQPTFMFAGHPHRGALDEDYLEVGVAMWRDGTLHAFHAMPLTSKWQHLRYQ